MGCGFGKSTQAFAAAAPAAELLGIDLSAGCLRLAAQQAPDALRNRLRFRQADAAASSLPAGAFDLVTSTMLLHEMPEAAILRLIEESARLLAPGGVAVHLDFLTPADPLRCILHAGHSRRNNEPFMLDLGQIDIADRHARAGFRQVTVSDFAEEDGALDGAGDKWRLPWTVIIAEK